MRACGNRYFQHIDLVERHLYVYGIDLTYTRWIFHGEENSCRVTHQKNVIGNLQPIGMNATTDEIDEV
jgi:uroporphyrinogen-III decarboxylase